MNRKRYIDNIQLSDPKKWVDLHGDCLFRCALLRVRDPQLAQDMVQETFLSALQSRDRFAGQSSERSWFVGILRHKIVDHFRKISRERSDTTVELLTDELDQPFDGNGHWKPEVGPIEWTDDPSLVLERNEFWEILKRCLSKLPPRMADAFSLREIDDLSSAKVCEVLNISPNNLWVMLHRARMHLRYCLEAHWFGLKTEKG